MHWERAPRLPGNPGGPEPTHSHALARQTVTTPKSPPSRIRRQRRSPSRVHMFLPRSTVFIERDHPLHYPCTPFTSTCSTKCRWGKAAPALYPLALPVAASASSPFGAAGAWTGWHGALGADERPPCGVSAPLRRGQHSAALFSSIFSFGTEMMACPLGLIAFWFWA